MCAAYITSPMASMNRCPIPTRRSEAEDSNLRGLTLNMKTLAEMPKAELIASLHRIELAYGIWIAADASETTFNVHSTTTTLGKEARDKAHPPQNADCPPAGVLLAGHPWPRAGDTPKTLVHLNRKRGSLISSSSKE